MEGKGKKKGKKQSSFESQQPQTGADQHGGKGKGKQENPPISISESSGDTQPARAHGGGDAGQNLPKSQSKYKQRQQQQQQQKSQQDMPQQQQQMFQQVKPQQQQPQQQQQKPHQGMPQQPQQQKQPKHQQDKPHQNQPQQQQQKPQHDKPQQQQQQQQKQEQPSTEPPARVKLSFKQRQQLKQKQEPQEPGPSQTPRETTPSSHDSSPSHAAALQKVEEDFGAMKIDKQKIQSTHLLPVLSRANAFGTRGKAISIEVNYVQLLVDRLIGSAYHYDVDIKPAASRKWQRAAFSAFAREMFPGYNFGFDGNKNAYSAKRLKTDYHEKEVTVREDGRERKFTVTMKEAAVVDMSCLKTYMNNGSLVKPMAAIQCLDVVLRTAYENNPNFVKFKKSIYAVPSQPEDIGANHELWYGLFQSALLGSKPFLNIDVSHKAFPSGGPVLSVLANLNRSSVPDQVPDWLARELTTYLKGMEISYTGPTAANKIFKFNRLKGPANKESFKLDNGTVVTVDQYFRQQGMPLRYPNLPVMHVGSLVRNVLLPIELCSIPRGQALTKKHPDQCTQMIIRRSATDTATRKRKIMDLFNQIGYNNSPAIKEFGVSVGNTFEKVDGRVIDPPSLIYRNNGEARPQRGVWRADNFNFLTPSTEVVRRELRWTILNLDFRTRPDAIEQFGRSISQMAQKQNVQLEPFSMRNNFTEPRDMRTCIRDLDNILQDLKQKQMDLVIVVIPAAGGPNGDVYAKVKQKAELVTGLLTQCIKGDTLFKKRGDLSTISNIWLKINAKTNGTNHVLKSMCKPPISRQKVMYIGADVTHPSPEQTNIPSVVGVSASYDIEGFRYNCCYRLQNPKDEMIRDLQNIVSKQIRLFKQQNGILPELIMYYRDGVSEGQFAEILTIELRAIQAAAADVDPRYKPKITFIVVQKRHHARFFPTANCPTEGRNNNVVPGTIVDRHITAPNQYQFFLVSHAAVQGVAKPTKYCVLYDDENCKPDELQALTYNLCHMFARCNRAVSYPAPTYYAHLAAYRGRVYIKDRALNMDNLLQEYQRLQIRTEIIDGHPMFFV
ncbi:protein argonaute-2 [Malaya genurostris]|uniref:protein argonaute-2 n=1 Tax=Malaya genurostris TaxID=325434 RepID=UPI0026F3ECA8|nr:protein argonaute-2 [Malaya genurostris]